MSPRILGSGVALFLLATGFAEGAAEPGRAERFQLAERAVVTIMAKDDVTALCHATAVRSNGLVVTKASTLDEYPELVARLEPGGAVAPVLSRWIDADNDLAVLATGFDGLTPIDWETPATENAVGTLIFALDPSEEVPRLGVVAALNRPIEKQSGMLGVLLDFRRPVAARIGEVFPGTAADTAGLLAGDVVIAVDGHEINDSKKLQERIFSHDPGDRVLLDIERDGKREQIEVRLGYRSDIFNLTDRNQLMSGETSRRRTGFAEILQHDIPLSPSEMGTPVLDLEGRPVGLNIARVDRVTTFALPAALITEILDDYDRSAAEE